jgi:hypothetical protein
VLIKEMSPSVLLGFFSSVVAFGHLGLLVALDNKILKSTILGTREFYNEP